MSVTGIIPFPLIIATKFELICYILKFEVNLSGRSSLYFCRVFPSYSPAIPPTISCM